MPDENKLQALRDHGFKIVPTCGTCIHFKPGSRSGWGHCKAISHTHQKHTGKDKPTGVPTNGYCDSYELEFKLLSPWVQSYAVFFHDERHDDPDV